MSNVAKLKKQAAELEAKKQFDKALAIYIKLLDSFDQNASELDVALFNRVGDLLLRQGNVADAVDYYEQAVDRYGETGFFNNAIALCNKILRHSPGRASIYYKLGKISAQKGFKNDAKVNFLEYADRMQKGGKVDEAFRALKEFADLCPDQDEIRLMLAEQLTKADRKAEAIEQLQTLHERYDSEGRASEAAATATRMRAIDPSVEPRSSGGGRRKTTSGDLIFIDLDSPSVGGSYIRQATPLAPIGRVPEPNANLSSALDPEIETEAEGQDLVEIPLINTDAVISTPASSASIDDPFIDITTADESLGLLKSTPTSSLFVIDPPQADDDSSESFGGTPVASAAIEESAAVEPASDLPFVADPVFAPTPLATPVVEEPIVAEPPSATPIATPIVDDFIVEEVAAASTIVEEIFVAEPIVAEPVVEEPVPEIDPFAESIEASFRESFVEPTPIAPIAVDAPTEDPSAADSLDEPFAPLTPLSTDAVVELATPPDPAEEFAPSNDEAPPFDDVEFELPGTPAAPAELASLDFDLATLTPSSDRDTPPRPATLRPTPNTTRVALDGLPLMDLELPVPTPLSTPAVAASESLSSELELIEDPGVGLMSDLMERGGTDDDPPLDLDAESLALEDEDTVVPTPSVARRSTRVAEHSVEVLRASVEREPENWSLRRQLAEAMLEAGHREEGIRELELAMNGAERFGDLDLASSLAEEIARLEPDAVRHHQKRVEYAFRTNDRSRLIEAYVSLADALLAAEQTDKARTVYQRVLDLAPDDVRARAGLDSLPSPDSDALSESRAKRQQADRRQAAAPVAESKPTPSAGSFVNLGDWLRDDAAPKDTRMVVEEQEPTGDEAADFADMLRKFKQGVAENVDAEDYQSHYDLAIAFKEMGLLDEAIAEFQKALGSPTNRLPTYEALGQCFLEKSQFKLASSILSRALNERAPEEQLVGVLYLLGRAAEAQGLSSDAVTYYQRVFVLDIQFRDTADRLSELERVAQ